MNKLHNIPSTHLLLASAAVSYFGSMLTGLASAATFSAMIAPVFGLSALFLCQLAPSIVLRPVLERILVVLGPTRSLVLAEVAQTLLTALLAILTILGVLTPVLLLVLVFAMATTSTLFISAFYINLPRLLDGESIARYTGLSGSISQIGGMLGGIMFAALFKHVEVATFFLLDALTFAFSGFVMFALLTRGETGEKNSAMRVHAPKLRLFEGLSPWAACSLVALPLCALQVFNVAQSTVSLKLSAYGADGLGMIDTACTLGIVVAGFAYARWFEHLLQSNGAFVIAAGILLSAIVLGSFTRHSLIASLGAAVAVGASYSLLSTIVRTNVYVLYDEESLLRRATLRIAMIENAVSLSVAAILPALLVSYLAMVVVYSASGVFLLAILCQRLRRS